MIRGIRALTVSVQNLSKYLMLKCPCFTRAGIFKSYPRRGSQEKSTDPTASMMSKRDTAGKHPHQSSSWCQSVHQIYVLIKTVQPLLSQRSVESEVKATGRSVCLCSPLGTIVLSQGPDHLSFKPGDKGSFAFVSRHPATPRIRNKNTKIPSDEKICER